jgi:membrane protease YdiL (CAAX protease family)
MTTWFFALAFGITWLVQAPAVLARFGVIPGPPEQYMNLAGLGLFGPAIAALIAARLEPGGAGTRAFFRSIWQWRVHPIWYLVALALPAAGYVLVRGAYGLVAPDAGPWLYPPADAQRVAALIVAPIGEEIGWRGFALPRLQQRFGRLGAATLLGALWGAWHLMMYLMVGIPPLVLVLSVVFLIPGSVLFSWLYNRSGGSPLIAIVLHMGVHLNNPNQVFPGTTTPFYLNIAAYTLLGALVLVDRAAWRARPDSPVGELPRAAA